MTGLLVISDRFPHPLDRQASFFVMEQILRLRKHFDEVYVFALVPRLPKVAYVLPFLSFANRRDSFAKDYTIDNVKVFFIRHIPPIHSSIRIRIGELVTKKIFYLIRKKHIEFDLIHAHFVYPSGYIGVNIRRNLRDLPLIISANGYDVHDLPFRSYRWQNLIRKILKASDHIIAVSGVLRNILIKLGADSSKISVIYNGFDDKLFSPIQTKIAREKLGLPQDKKILVSVGRLVPVKGHEYLIRAMKYIVQIFSNVNLYIVGGGKLALYLRRLIDKLNLSNHVFLVGTRPHSEIPLWINASDIFVLPSLNEGCPLVVLESLGCGKPIVSTAVGCIPELINDENLGIVVSPKNEKALAHGIISGLSKKWDRSYIRKYAEQFSWDRIAEKIYSVYRIFL